MLVELKSLLIISSNSWDWLFVITTAYFMGHLDAYPCAKKENLAYYIIVQTSTVNNLVILKHYISNEFVQKHY